MFLDKMPLIISINGNIACGKSTLLRKLEERGNSVIMEGLDRLEWGDVLSMYYENPARYGFLFQTLIAVEMKETFSRLRRSTGSGATFTERSHIDCLAFARLVWRRSDMTNVEYQTFKRLFDIIYEKPDVVISLELNPKVCFERCKVRGRSCESVVTLDYLQAVHDSTLETMREAPPLQHFTVDVLGKTTDAIADELETIARDILRTEIESTTI